MLNSAVISASQRVVILGGGFGGLYAAKALRGVPVTATLVDRHNYHLFQPLLYQVATGGLSPANIAAPLRSVLRGQRNVRVLLAEVQTLDVAARCVRLRDGEALPYDTLVVATGAENNYFGHADWAPLAPGLKGLEDATRIRARIFSAFETAERAATAEAARPWLTFVVVGAGPTGVELAGALAEIARDTLRREFRRVDPRAAQILLVDAVDRVLPGYPAALSTRAAASLTRLGVQVRPGVKVADIQPGLVVLEHDGQRETIATRTVLWAAGVRPSTLGAALANAAGVQTDRQGRVPVAPDLTLPGHPEVFVIGDLALCIQDGAPLQGIAPVAMQQGRYVAQRIAARLRGAPPGPPFRYRDYGRMATIGRAAAVAELGRVWLWGYPAWLMWLFVHLMYLAQFQNRVLVFLQWAWNYFTFNRAARLITTDPASARDPEPAA
jgi:NADH:ubiquinone reductase (H+-translocating)